MKDNIYFGLFVLDNDKIPSINEMYKIGRSRTSSWVFKNPAVAEFQDSLISQRKYNNFNEASDHSDIIKAELYLKLMLSSNYKMRDASNMIKATEDAIVKITGIDDRHTTRLTVTKCESNHKKHEFILASYILTCSDKCKCRK